MKHLRKNLTSLAVALAMTLALCAAVIFSGQTAAVAESAPEDPVRETTLYTEETAPVDEAELLKTLPMMHAAVEAPPSPSPMGALAGALNAPQVQKARNEAKKAEEEAKKAEEEAKAAEEAKKKAEEEAAKAAALPASDTSVIYAGTVNSSGVRIRTSPVSGSVITNLDYGTTVSVLGQQDGWYQVKYDGKTGYMSGDYLTVQTSASGLSGYGRVETDALYLRTGPGSGYGALLAVGSGEYVSISGFENGWYAVSYNGSAGYMSGDYLTPVASKPAAATTSTGSSAPAASVPSEPAVSAPAPSSAYGGGIADYAARFLGTPYVYGGSSPYGFDCSGFTMYVFSQFGYSLPHGASGQMGCGTAVSRSELQAGDLVFFYDPSYGGGGVSATHVGIYVGGGQFIHASSYGGGVCYSDLNDPWYYSPLYCGARRIG